MELTAKLGPGGDLSNGHAKQESDDLKNIFKNYVIIEIKFTSE
jgi:hypothetical protein